MDQFIIIPKGELTKLINDAVRASIAPLLSIMPVNEAEPEEYLTVVEAAKLLHKTKETVYLHVRKGSFPVRKVGNRLLFKRDELIKWVEERRRKSASEIRDAAKQRNN